LVRGKVTFRQGGDLGSNGGRGVKKKKQASSDNGHCTWGSYRIKREGVAFIFPKRGIWPGEGRFNTEEEEGKGRVQSLHTVLKRKSSKRNSPSVCKVEGDSGYRVVWGIPGGKGRGGLTGDKSKGGPWGPAKI